MRVITVKLPDVYIEGIDELVKLGKYASRSEAIREAIRDLLRRELWINDDELKYDKRNLKHLNGFNNIKVIKIQ